MKAIVRDRYGSTDVLAVVAIEKPVPGDHDVLVRVHAASLNMADLDYMRGSPYSARVATGLSKPKNSVLGLDVAGRVEAVGINVEQLKPGDEIWADMTGFGYGAFAEYVCAPESAFALKPASLTFEEAATVPQSAVLALQGLRGGRPIEPGQKVLINGAGGCVGPFAVQIAKSFGAEVTGVDSTGKLDLLRSIGADHVIDYTQEDFTRNGQRYDLILDIAASRSILDFRRSLGPRGSYVLVARSVAGFFQALFLGGWISMTGSKKMGIFVWVPNKREDLDFLKGLLEVGKIKPIIDRDFELSEVPEALRYLEQGHARGKVVITVKV
jgi:NADPH:quinone reductase-like Zn-dependent oxidoreductase